MSIASLDFPRLHFFFLSFLFSTGKRVESIHVNNRRVVRKYRVPSQIITVLKGSARSTRDRVPTTSPSLNDQANHVALRHVINRFGRWCAHFLIKWPTARASITSFIHNSLYIRSMIMNFSFLFFFFNETRYIHIYMCTYVHVIVSILITHGE